MAVVAGDAPQLGFVSPDPSLKEDVSDLIYQPTPDETPLYDMMSEKMCGSPYHSWMTRDVSHFQNPNAQPEGFVYAYTGINLQYPNPRRFNQTQIFARPVRVSETDAVSNHWAIDDVVGDQVNLALVGIKTDVEWALHYGTTATGLTGVARKFGGILEFLTSGITTYTNVTAAVSLTETIFNDHIELVWKLGGHPADVLVNGYLKRRISGYTGNSMARNALAADMVLYNAIQLYYSDFNITVAIHADRQMPTPAGGLTGHGIVFLDKTVSSKVFLRKFVMERTPKVADSYDAMVKGELTAEWGHPVFHAFGSQYK